MGSSEYKAGACNIGGQERSRRRKLGYASLAVGAVYVVAVLAAGLPDRFVLGSFIFVYGGVLGILQARRQFCVAFAMTGRYGFDGDEGEVVANENRASDRKQAFLLSAQATAVAVFVTSICYGLAVSL